MPTYSYRCTECDNAFDIQQAFTDSSLTVCPVCGGKLRKVFGILGVTFNGPGFYRTDSRTADSKHGSKHHAKLDGAKSEGEGGKSDAAKSDAVKSDSSKSDSKPAVSAPATKPAGSGSPSSPSSSRRTTTGNKAGSVATK